MNLPDSLENMIDQMDSMLDQSIADSNPMGLFTALYQKVTIRIKEGIAQGRFEDGPRMERFDLVFANRFFEAYQKYEAGFSTTHSWKAAFDATERTDLAIIQHLLMGMNAHINLDLGIAAAEVSQGADLDELKKDFMEINNLLFELVEDVKSNIASVSPLILLINLVSKDKDEKIAKFSMKAARQHAWLVAQRMSLAKSTERQMVIEGTDKYVVGLNQLITNPGRFFSFVFKLIRLVESKNIAKCIRALRYKKRH